MPGPLSPLSIMQRYVGRKIPLPDPPTLYPFLQIYMLYLYFRSYSKLAGCCFVNVPHSITPTSPSKMRTKASQRSKGVIPAIARILHEVLIWTAGQSYSLLESWSVNIAACTPPSYILQTRKKLNLFFISTVAMHSGKPISFTHTYTSIPLLFLHICLVLDLASTWLPIEDLGRAKLID